MPRYRDLLLNTFLTSCHDDDVYIRASSLSNLGQICRLLRWALGPVIHEVRSRDQKYNGQRQMTSYHGNYVSVCWICINPPMVTQIMKSISVRNLQLGIRVFHEHDFLTLNCANSRVTLFWHFMCLLTYSKLRIN